MVFMFETKNLLKQQLHEVELWHGFLPEADFSAAENFPRLVSIQHQVNFELWHQEDLARDLEVSDSKIAEVKRTIDVFNQRRNDLIEQMDQFLLNIINAANVKNNDETEMNSETPGSMIDRLSINALKIYHMDEEVQREEVTAEHRNKCAAKLSILREQRHDLEQCLTKLLADLSSGEKRLKVYQQMKMYNDENLNPVLYRKADTR